MRISKLPAEVPLKIMHVYFNWIELQGGMSGLALTRQRPANFALLYIVQQPEDEAAAANYFVVVLRILTMGSFYQPKAES